MQRFRGLEAPLGKIMELVSQLRAGVTARATAAFVLIAGFASCMALNWPGQLSFDSLIQLKDGRTGHYGTWHPPIMAWLLGVGDSLVAGTGIFILSNTVVLFASLLSLLWLPRRVSWWAACVALLCIAMPQLLLYQGTVWKDVLFADAAVAGFICLAHACSRWSGTRTRLALLGLSFALLVLAALARQNGGIVVVIGALAAGVIAWQKSGPRSGFAYGAGTLAGASMLMVGSSLALATRTHGPSGIGGQFTLLETYDIVGAAKDRPGVDLGIIARANPDLADLIRSDGVPLYTPQRNDTLASSPDLQSELNDTPPGVISAQWRDLIVRYPLLYLGIRSQVFAWIFLTPDILRCVPYHVGVEGPDALIRDLKLETQSRPQDVALGNYAGALLHTPVFSHAAFATLAAILLVILIRRQLPGDLAIAFMLVAALTFTLSFFVIAIACDYRYLLFLDLSSLAAALHVAASPQSREASA